MVNIILMAHAEIANSFLCCVKHILAKDIDHLHTLPVQKFDDSEFILASAESLVGRIGLNKEILILSDIYGATPSNIAQKILKPGLVELITGLNLPMLIRAISYSKAGLKECIKKALDGGTNGIIHLEDKKC